MNQQKDEDVDFQGEENWSKFRTIVVSCTTIYTIAYVNLKIKTNKKTFNINNVFKW